MQLRAVSAVLLLGAVGGITTSASAVVIQTGLYRLHNHPDGNAQPPRYGLRLDELYNATSGHDIFTFDFDDSHSAMFLEWNGSTIHIYGHSWGGRDTGSGYANDGYRRLYDIDFTYTQTIALVSGDDDLFVDPPYNFVNTGTITPQGGTTILLRDGHYSGDQLDFRLGDENDDQGHRGYHGISGWGWLFHGPYGTPYTADSDWLFTAELIPAPGVVALLGLGGLVAGRRRR